ncbi:hypothetical protein ATANTOWER_006745 [Ataeniobius toweri]|uniref:Uncharacterized protein n=1 Tax=Ataeniobius toweri TaxID=208326 RepID=A0ABU7C097_9TELE|nr:hypothetical protein [Ataeniobius toweri]
MELSTQMLMRIGLCAEEHKMHVNHLRTLQSHQFNNTFAAAVRSGPQPFKPSNELLTKISVLLIEDANLHPSISPARKCGYRHETCHSSLCLGNFRLASLVLRKLRLLSAPLRFAFAFQQAFVFTLLSTSLRLSR